MRESLVGVAYTMLNVDEYLADFANRFELLGQSLWKLERQQEFREPGYPSWDAFAAGRVAESVSLAEAARAEIVEYQRDLAARDVQLHRVRLVASPPTPYLWWESHILRIRAEAGERIRALDVDAVADLESAEWTLPEVVVIGDAVMYSVQYDTEGVLSGAYRYEKRDLINAWVRFIADLFNRAEPFDAYYSREIKDLPDRHSSGI
ncbi:DUF6879 family protein [Paractinoplanes durhamensis]|uniref:DUF6879 domain-containing protein n=1 Tax=Paractinoplanes durhamensis TaxID=113563 RepID=A0ABQ3Z6Q1_9ACTN|nr:DUF6879 family protein [Actinoplanes durhamensis]GIE05525.1 hypothetical protein Adu01nite_68750 [Actinoplanes durhamensis]